MSACLLTLLQTELGLLWLGRFRTALLYCVSWCLLLTILAFSGVLRHFAGMALFIAAFLVVKFAFIIFACFAARSPITLSWYNRWCFYIGIPMALALASGFYSDWVKENSYRALKVSSSANSPTLIQGDYIIIDRSGEEATPSRQQLVAFMRPDDVASDIDESDTFYLSRIIALPGDTVQVTDNTAIVNGSPLVEPYATKDSCSSQNCDFGPVKIPEGSVFLLGDNRARSRDSRFWTNPFVPIKDIIGHPLYVYFSRKDFSRIGMTIN